MFEEADISTIIGSRLATSFKIGDFYVTANGLAESLVAYCDPALFHYQDWPPQNFFLSGSSFRFSYRGRFYAIITAHHMDVHNVDASQFAILNQNSQHMTSSSGMVFADDEDFDLRLFDFTDPFNKGSIGTKNFWRATHDELFQPTPSALRVFCVGYPGEANFINFETNEFSARPFCVWGEMIEPKMRNRLSFIPTKTSLGNVAGLSGSPVFGIRLVETEPVCFWAGIVTNASLNAFNFIPSARIGKMIEFAQN